MSDRPISLARVRARRSLDRDARELREDVRQTAALQLEAGVVETAWPLRDIVGLAVRGDELGPCPLVFLAPDLTAAEEAAALRELAVRLRSSAFAYSRRAAAATASR